MKTLPEILNRPLPRYTSYPPANFFHQEFTADDLLRELSASNEKEPEHISIYIHVPFCPLLCHYCGCNAIKMESKEIINSYAETLKKEMKLVFSHLSPTRKVSQIHFGGGTPSTLPVKSIQELVTFIFNSFDRIEKPEIAIECHPAYLQPKLLNGLKDAGFNRISLGIQDFNKEVLQSVNRLPEKMPIETIISFIHQKMKASVNLDFIYGLPKQTPESYLESIRLAVSLSPDRIVTFPYTHMPQLFSRQRVLEKIGLPPAEEKQKMFDLASEFLQQNAYFSIGMDHFVLKEDELLLAKEEKQLHRNFQGYCSRKTTGQVYAFGVSGISQLTTCYAQNTKDVAHYIASVQKGELAVDKGYRMNKQEQIARNIIGSLMCNFEAEISDGIWCDRATLSTLQEHGIIDSNGCYIRITEDGKPFVRHVATCFDQCSASFAEQHNNKQ